MKKLGERRNSLRQTSESLEKVEGIEKLHDQLHEKTQDLLEAQEMCSDLQKEIDDLQNDFSIKELTLNESILKASQEVLSLKNQVKVLKKEKKRLEGLMEDMKKSLDSVKSEAYDRNTQIQKLEQEKKLMNDYMKEKLNGEELDSLLKVKQKITDLIEENRVLQEQLTSTRSNYEEIVESLKHELGMLNKYKSSSNKSMWTHVDQLNRQIEEKSRM
jgi:chromosome segregation ATPase